MFNSDFILYCAMGGGGGTSSESDYRPDESGNEEGQLSSGDPDGTELADDDMASGESYAM